MYNYKIGMKTVQPLFYSPFFLSYSWPHFCKYSAPILNHNNLYPLVRLQFWAGMGMGHCFSPWSCSITTCNKLICWILTESNSSVNVTKPTWEMTGSYKWNWTDLFLNKMKKKNLNLNLPCLQRLTPPVWACLYHNPQGGDIETIVSYELAFFNLVLMTIYSAICSLLIHYL